MSKQDTLKIIEKKRAELIEIALKNGLNSSISIIYSQELDQLLNLYYKLEPSKSTSIHNIPGKSP